MGQQKKPIDDGGRSAGGPEKGSAAGASSSAVPKPPSLQEQLKRGISAPSKPPPAPGNGAAGSASRTTGTDGGSSKGAPPPLPGRDSSPDTAATKGMAVAEPRTRAPADNLPTAPKSGPASRDEGPARPTERPRAPGATAETSASAPSSSSERPQAPPTLGVPSRDAAPNPPIAPPDGPSLSARPALVPEPSEDDQVRRKAKRRPAGPSRTQIAANDDSPSIGGLIYALNQKPSNRPFTLATIASGAWLVFGIVFGYIALGPDIAASSSFSEFIRGSAFVPTVAGIVGPVMLVWFLAFLAWRSEEMHLRSTAMTEVAVRLAEPDRLAEGQVASLGQTVRREVDYMNDAVSQALDRASELDAIMKAEVAALERSYEDNERKIRGLLQELASERNSLTGTGEHFRQTLSHLAEDVPVLIERLSQQQAKLSGLVTGAGENLTALEQSLAQQTTRLETTLESRSEQMQSLLTSRTQELDAAIGTYAKQIAAQAETVETALSAHASQINTRTDDVRVMLAAQAENVEQTLGDYATALGTILDQRGKQLVGQVETTVLKVDDAVSGLDTKAKQISDRLAETGSAINAELDQRIQSIDTSLDQRMQSIDDVISQRTETLQTVFEEYALALDTTLANRATALDTQLVERTKALDEAFNDRLRLFDEAIVRSTAAIDSAIAENARSLTQNMETHANLLSETINQQAAELDENLLKGISAVRETSENISRQSIRAIEGLASQADMLKSVSENLLGQINTVTTRFENQGQSILRSANALESANYKIDKALGARTEALNETLDRLSSKAQEIGSAVDGYSTQIESQMSDAEQRTRLLTQELGREAEERSRSTLDQISRLKTEAIREKDRALEELRSEFETVTREVTERLGVLTQQFSQTSGDVRLTARRAAEGIEADQARLKAQLDKLPTATQETSEAMRRALADQLRAIDQLAQYARATGAARDVRQPVSAAAKTPERSSSPQQDSARAPRSLSSLTNALTNEINQRSAAPTAGSRAVVPAQHAQGPGVGSADGRRAQHADAGTANSQSWMMGDLLARASLDDETPAGASLDTAAIAKAMDPSLAAAIWARVQAGQRGFMVTSIYPAPARALFTETQQRYASGGAFRTNVDQFLADFDAMLRNANAQDPSGKSASDLITSESGRVYLFLAHVSGRLT
jgi:hypothetical protein